MEQGGTFVENSKDSIETRLGKEVVELNNFDYQEDGLIGDRFILDGDDDYITIDLKKLREKNDGKDEKWFENGFTFEFYGTVAEGKKYAYKDEFTR